MRVALRSRATGSRRGHAASGAGDLGRPPAPVDPARADRSGERPRAPRVAPGPAAPARDRGRLAGSGQRRGGPGHGRPWRPRGGVVRRRRVGPLRDADAAAPARDGARAPSARSGQSGTVLVALDEAGLVAMDAKLGAGGTRALIDAQWAQRPAAARVLTTKDDVARLGDPAANELLRRAIDRGRPRRRHPHPAPVARSDRGGSAANDPGPPGGAHDPRRGRGRAGHFTAGENDPGLLARTDPP
jgi:hypothetical protein